MFTKLFNSKSNEDKDFDQRLWYLFYSKCIDKIENNNSYVTECELYLSSKTSIEKSIEIKEMGKNYYNITCGQITNNNIIFDGKWKNIRTTKCSIMEDPFSEE